MNLTFSADEDLIAKARAYAQARNVTLNQLIREFMERITGRIEGPRAADEFAALASGRPGRSEEGFQFRRSEVHQRPWRR